MLNLLNNVSQSVILLRSRHSAQGLHRPRMRRLRTYVRFTVLFLLMVSGMEFLLVAFFRTDYLGLDHLCGT